MGADIHAESDDSAAGCPECSCSAEDIQALEGQVARLNEEVKSASAGAESYKQKIETLTEELAAAKGESTKAEVCESDLASAKEAKSVMKTKLEQAENKANKAVEQLQAAKSEQEENAGAAGKELKALQAKVTALEAKLAAAEETLAGGDVQALLTLRQTSADGLAALQEHSEAGLAALQEHSKVGLEAATKHYETASQEATRMYNKAAPMIAESHKQAMEAVGPALEAMEPHVETAKGHFRFGLSYLTEQFTWMLEEAAKHVPQIAPHTELAAKILAHVILLLPLGALGLFLFFGLIRLTSLLLLKLEYAMLFTLLGVVLAFSTTAFVTQKDPVALLRTSSPETYTTLHHMLGGISGALAVIQFSVLLSKAKNGGKGPVALFMSLVAAGMNVLLSLHYYNLVYKKAETEPSFSMSFEIKGDGGASYAEYTIFTAAVVLVSALATPPHFRFSVRACVMALEGVCGGFSFGMVMLSTVLENPVGTLMKTEHVPLVMAGVLGALSLVLFLRLLLRDPSFVVSLGHCVFVAFALRAVVPIPLDNFMSGATGVLPTDEVIRCGTMFLVLLFLQVLCTDYEGGASTKKAKPSTSMKKKKQL